MYASVALWIIGRDLWFKESSKRQDKTSLLLSYFFVDQLVRAETCAVIVDWCVACYNIVVW